MFNRFNPVKLLSLVCLTLTILLSSNTGAFAKIKGPLPVITNLHAPNELLVKVKPGKNISIANLLLGGKTIQSINRAGVQRIKLSPGTSLSTAIALYANNPNVEYVEPNYLRKAAFIPDDADVNKQWALADINAEQAWDINKGSTAIKIAIIDTGIDSNHPDLAGKIYNPYNVLNQSTDVQDDVGHGTHVAGIAGAALNNQIGIAGVGGNVEIMPIKAGDSSGFYDSDIAMAIGYAVTNGAKIINLSLGGYDSSQTLQDAVASAEQQGVLVVAAAGNDATNTPCYPAAYPGVIAVAATDQNDVDASFSNWGSDIAVSAPGLDIYSTTPTYPLNDGIAEDYDSLSGTSMASPEVAGLAGLVLSAKPSLSPLQVTKAITSNAKDADTPGWDAYTGYGRIDAFKTLKDVTTAPLLAGSTPGQNAVGVATNQTISVTFSKTIYQGPAYTNIVLKDQNNNTLAVSKTLSATTLSIKPVGGLQANSSYSISIPTGALTDYYGNNLAAAATLQFTTVTVADNTAPLLKSTNPVNNAVNVATNQSITVAFSEPITGGSSFNSIAVTDTSNNSVSFTPAITGNILTLTAARNLKYSTLYTVVLPAGAVKDLAGNELAAGYSFRFTTAGVQNVTLREDNTLGYTGIWRTYINGNNSAGTARYTSTVQAAITFSFTGSSFELAGYKSPWYGFGDVYVDGVKVGSIDYYSPGVQYRQILFSKGGLSSGTHVVKLVNTGVKNPKAGGSGINIDYVLSGNGDGLGTLEETNANLLYTGSWQTYNNTRNAGGSARYTGSRGSTVSLNFSGTSLKLVGYKSPWYGIGDVYIDGVKVGSIDYYSAGAQFQQVLFSKGGLAQRQHWLKVVATGNKDRLAAGTGINLDSVTVGNAGGAGRFEEMDANLLYGGSWQTYHDTRNSAGSARYTGSTGSVVFLNFSGSSLQLVGYKSPWYGIGDVYIDGVKAGSIDYYSAGVQFQQVVYSKNGLRSGLHWVKIIATGRKNAHAYGVAVNLDSVAVQ